MSKADKNDLIYFKEACDKTYTASRSKDSDSIIQQTVDGKDIFPKTIAEAVIMSDGKTLEEFMQSGGGNPITRVEDMTISGVTAITSTGTYQYGLAFSPNNYNVDIESVTVTSDCSEITISNVSAAGFTMNVNSVPSATSHKLTLAVKDKLGSLFTKEFAFTVKVEPTDMTITGSQTIENGASSRYTISYTPSGYNVTPTVTVTSNQPSVPVSNIMPSMFVLNPNCEESLSVELVIKATFPSGRVITKVYHVEVNCGPDYDAIDEYGVGIMTVNGKFYSDSASWINAGSPTANGIAVSDGTYRFCIAKDIIQHVCSTAPYKDQEYWGAYNTKVSGVYTKTTKYDARADYNGVANTDAIVANVTSSDQKFTKFPWSAAGLCRQFTFPDGSKGYLGALGEWDLVQDSISKINTLMSAIGGAQIDTNPYGSPKYWSSTQYSGNDAWYWDFDSANWINYTKHHTIRVRAFSAF